MLDPDAKLGSDFGNHLLEHPPTRVAHAAVMRRRARGPDQQLIAASRAMDANAVAEAFATDGVSIDPVGSPPREGRDAIRQFIQGATAAIERIESTADNVFIVGDGAAFKWSMHLTSKSGQSVTVEGIDVIQVNEQGKIQALHAYWDPAPLLAVLGGQAG